MLASESPRRREMLERIGVPFDVVAPQVAEVRGAREAPDLFAARAAHEKAAAVRADGRVVLGADTVVIIDGDLLGKPRDDADARAMLMRLSGRTHAVVTAYTILSAQEISRIVTTDVTFRTLSADEIDAYVATGEPRDKAGAYAIQGIAAAFVTSVRGSYTNVVGLPLAEVVEDLAACGAIEWPGVLTTRRSSP